MNKLLLILASVALLHGCALMSDQVQQSATKLGEGIAAYCANMPASERPAFRADVEQACGCKIELICPE